MKKIVWILLLLALLAAGWWGWQRYAESGGHEVLSREAVITRIQNLNRLETMAFQIDAVIRTQKEGNWYNLWQDSQKGLFLVHGSVVAGVDLAQLQPEHVRQDEQGQIHIQLPPVSVFQVNLDNIEVYDIKTGSLGLHPVDTSVFETVQHEARAQVLARACEAQILILAGEQAQKQITALFALADVAVTVETAPPAPCRMP